MFLSKKSRLVKRSLFIWMTGTVLLVGAAAALAQREPAFDNRRLSDYGPVGGKGGQEVTGPYRVVLNWPQPLQPGWTVSGDGLYVESPDRVYVGGRGTNKDQYPHIWGPVTIRELHKSYEIPASDTRREHLVSVYDRNGKMLESWDQWDATIGSIQRIQVSPYDPERHIWITTGRQILEFTHDGKKLVRTISQKDVPQTPPHFHVEELAWTPNGDVYAGGGFQVTKFSKDGKYLAAFGELGTGPGQFGTGPAPSAGPADNSLDGTGIHGIVIDSTRRRIYVADRVNSRIQVFDENFKFLDQWPHIIAPYCIRLTKDGRYLWISDGYVMKLAKYDALTGKLVPNSTWGTFGAAPGAFWAPHDFTTDSEGNLYVAEDYNARAQKFVPRKDGNPEQLIGPLQ